MKSFDGLFSLRRVAYKVMQCLFCCALMTMASMAYAQSAIYNYADYPQKRGQIQPLHWDVLPAWMTISMELRSRTEGQTSYAYTQNGDRIYDLTRNYISLEVRPTSFLTGYLQSTTSGLVTPR